MLSNRTFLLSRHRLISRHANNGVQGPPGDLVLGVDEDQQIRIGIQVVVPLPGRVDEERRPVSLGQVVFAAAVANALGGRSRIAGLCAQQKRPILRAVFHNRPRAGDRGRRGGGDPLADLLLGVGNSRGTSRGVRTDWSVEWRPYQSVPKK